MVLWQCDAAAYTTSTASYVYSSAAVPHWRAMRTLESAAVVAGLSQLTAAKLLSLGSSLSGGFSETGRRAYSNGGGRAGARGGWWGGEAGGATSCNSRTGAAPPHSLLHGGGVLPRVSTRRCGAAAELRTRHHGAAAQSWRQNGHAVVLTRQRSPPAIGKGDFPVAPCHTKNLRQCACEDPARGGSVL